MSEEIKTLYIVVDAFRSDYIDEKTMPLTYKLANNSKFIKEIVPSPGFCERVEMECVPVSSPHFFIFPSSFVVLHLWSSI